MVESVKMSVEELEELRTPVEQILTKGHGEVNIILKIADHRIVDWDIKAQFRLRSNGEKK